MSETSYAPTFEDYKHLLTCFNHGATDWEVSPNAGKTSLKKWLESHNNQSVDTLQVTCPKPNTFTHAWHAGVRTVQVKATYAVFTAPDSPNGSRRVYRGVKVLAHSDDRIVCVDSDMSTILVYCVR